MLLLYIVIQVNFPVEFVINPLDYINKPLDPYIVESINKKLLELDSLIDYIPDMSQRLEVREHRAMIHYILNTDPKYYDK